MKPELVSVQLGFAKRHLGRWYWQVRLIIAHPWGQTAKLQRSVIANGHALTKRRAVAAANQRRDVELAAMKRAGRIKVGEPSA